MDSNVARAKPKAPRRNPAQIRQATRDAVAQAEQSGDVDAAMAHWHALRAEFPELKLGYLGALRTLRRLKRMDLAKPILDEGMVRLATDAEFIALAASIALDAHQYGEADELWQRAAALEPGNAEYALKSALVPMAERRGREARMPEVFNRLQLHHKTFPNYVPAFAAHVDALRESRQLKGAEERSAKWCERFPDDLKLMLARAGVHEDGGDFETALREISAFRARAPESAPLEIAYIRALSCAGQNAAAESACEAARLIYPDDRLLWLEYARLASRQGQWAECVQRLRAALRHFPGAEMLARELSVAQLQLAEPEAAAEAPEAAPQIAAETAMFNQFESLGGSGMGCEFGMVQARFDSKSVGLLRWARTAPPEMIAAIDAGFAGVGDPEFTEVGVTRMNVGNEQYVTRDHRYLMESHTFIKTTDAPADRMYTQTCRRLVFLRNKLLEDLRAAEKIFLYRSEQTIGDKQVLAMHAALQSHGPNTLLCVMRAHGDHLGGQMRALRPGAYVGYVNHFALDQGGATGSDVENWIAVCNQALSARHAKH